MFHNVRRDIFCHTFLIDSLFCWPRRIPFFVYVSLSLSLLPDQLTGRHLQCVQHIWILRSSGRTCHWLSIGTPSWLLEDDKADKITHSRSKLWDNKMNVYLSFRTPIGWSLYPINSSQRKLTWTQMCPLNLFCWLSLAKFLVHGFISTTRCFYASPP